VRLLQHVPHHLVQTVHCSAEFGQARSGQAYPGTDTHQDPERCLAGPAEHGMWSCSATARLLLLLLLLFAGTDRPLVHPCVRPSVSRTACQCLFVCVCMCLYVFVWVCMCVCVCVCVCVYKSIFGVNWLILLQVPEGPRN
jgi:hypothetical protein